MDNIGKAIKVLASEALEKTAEKTYPSQKIRLLEYLLKNGSIANPLTAWSRLGIYRLSDVIFRLRKAGIEIDTELVDVKNQYNEVCRVACYKLREWQPKMRLVK